MRNKTKNQNNKTNKNQSHLGWYAKFLELYISHDMPKPRMTTHQIMLDFWKVARKEKN